MNTLIPITVTKTYQSVLVNKHLYLNGLMKNT